MKTTNTQDCHPSTFEHENVKIFLALQRAKTARRLGTALVVMLGLLEFGHYATVLTLGLSGNGEIVKDLQPVFDSFLPVLSGLLSAAAAYFFGCSARK